jgi:hypothetical protein
VTANTLSCFACNLTRSVKEGNPRRENRASRRLHGHELCHRRRRPWRHAHHGGGANGEPANAVDHAASVSCSPDKAKPHLTTADYGGTPTPSPRRKRDPEMTRLNQKASERQTLDTVLNALGLRPDAEPVEGEAPDFVVTLSGRRIGVEVTMYRSGDTVEGGSERRQQKLSGPNYCRRRMPSEARDLNCSMSTSDRCSKEQFLPVDCMRRSWRKSPLLYVPVAIT